jgi:predicted RecA/RadA family phage recombinase
MAEATLYKDDNANSVEVTAPEALSAGEVMQTADGRVGVTAGLQAIASGAQVTLFQKGKFTFAKIASIVVLDGCKMWFDRSASTASPIQTADSFYIGAAVGDQTAAATTVVVELNAKPSYTIEYGRTQFTTAATDGLGVTTPVVGSPEVMLSFDAAAEVAMAAIYSVDTVPVADGPILEGKFAVYGIGDNAALDISIGLANGTHATDFDSVTEAVIIHLDGTAMSILVESDDGTTEVAATDSTIDAVDDTYFELWIDCRDLSDIGVYIDGVATSDGETKVLSAATGPLIAIAHIEKTSDDTVADVRVLEMTVRSTDIA